MARNYPRQDLALSALANLKLLIGRIWTKFGSFLAHLSVKSGIIIRPGPGLLSEDYTRNRRAQ
jgi:hypothetical protein